MSYAVSDTTEKALEQAIERSLTGTTSEAQAQGITEPAAYGVSGAYRLGHGSDFDATLALDTARFWAFLETTQSKALEKLKTRHPADWQARILGQYDKLIKRKGVLHLLKKGLPVEDAHFTLMYPAPLASSAQAVHDHFAANVWSVTRQVHHSLANPNESIDMVLFVNGLPIVTLELKNAWTQQTARYHGQKQYRDRDATQPLLQFGRVLVHMTADTDEAWMATKLAGGATWFLPFNKGHNEGAGNPPNPNGHRTAYLWEEVFKPDSLAGIIQHFVLLEGKSTDPLAKKNLIFPRYHQLNVVRKLLAHTAVHGVGQSYLIQHSAGSGKSNSITWAAYQLIESYPEQVDLPGAKALDAPLFDSVIVVTDRRLLDKQLRENIKDFSEVKNIVAPAMRSSDLRAALENGKKIIITTIQKFPFIIDGIADLSDKRFAVIIDEAHSGQTSHSQGNMNKAMGGSAETDDEDNQDELDELLESVDLSSYGLGRTKLNHAITLDAEEATLDPQNPNPRGYREEESQKDPLEEIIKTFNERWFQGWSATPEEQRVKFLNILDSVRAHPDFEQKFSDNPDPYSREIAFDKIMKEVMLKRRKEEMELYKLHAQDPTFKAAFYQSLKNALMKTNISGFSY
jgi:type I restriction enzyme R subunit